MKNILFYFGIAFFASCITPIPIEIGTTEPKIVVNSLITTDQNIEVYIGSSSSITDTTVIPIHPVVELYEDNNLVTQLQPDSAGIYKANYTPLSLRQYKIKVTDSILGICSAVDTIPEKVPISEAEFYIPAGFDEYGTPYYEATVRFSDPPAVSNYYELLIYKEGGDLQDYYIGNYITSNPIIVNEGDQDYSPNSLFFSDELFNGELFEISIKFQSGFQMLNPETYAPDGNYYVILRSVSSSYYKFRKYWTRHAYNQTLSEDLLGMFFKGEPIDAYTNIVNGYGIFVGYNQDIKSMTLINK